jgi:hypothetical protein
MAHIETNNKVTLMVFYSLNKADNRSSEYYYLRNYPPKNGHNRYEWRGHPHSHLLCHKFQA